MTSFVDTNVFIDYLVGHDPERFNACRDLMRAAEAREVELETSTMVIAELVWFLERPPLRLPAAEVHGRIRPLLRLDGLRLPDRDLVATALEQHVNSSMNFVDAYNLALMRKRRIARIYTYDTDFDGIPDVERVYP
ncbi:MAG: PIN domain-containing protein [Gaiellales bacterium]